MQLLQLKNCLGFWRLTSEHVPGSSSFTMSHRRFQPPRAPALLGIPHGILSVGHLDLEVTSVGPSDDLIRSRFSTCQTDATRRERERERGKRRIEGEKEGERVEQNTVKVCEVSLPLNQNPDGHHSTQSSQFDLRPVAILIEAFQRSDGLAAVVNTITHRGETNAGTSLRRRYGRNNQGKGHVTVMACHKQKQKTNMWHLCLQENYCRTLS